MKKFIIVNIINLLLIIGVLISTIIINYDKDVIVYENGDGYSIETGTYPNDTTPSSFIVAIESTSKILETDLVDFNEGCWYFNVGRIANVNYFKIKVVKYKYLPGTKKYINFYYKDKKLNQKYSKFY